MEYVEGADLRGLVAGNGPLPVAEGGRAVRQAGGLGSAAAHARGPARRNLKLQTVLLAGVGEVTLLDLGLARLAEGAGTTRAARGGV